MVFCKFVSELAIKRVTFLELKIFRHEKSKQPLEPTGRQDTIDKTGFSLNLSNSLEQRELNPL